MRIDGNVRSPTGYKNCKRCTRWRPVSDFGYSRIFKHSNGMLSTIYAKPICKHCEAAVKRESYHRWTPERLQRQREYNREWITFRRREQGTQPRVVGPKNKGSYGGGRVRHAPGANSVDPAPVLREAARAGYNRGEIAAMAGVDPRSVYRWIEEGERMELSVADRLCQALGVHLTLIYGCE